MLVAKLPGIYVGDRGDEGWTEEGPEALEAAGVTIEGAAGGLGDRGLAREDVLKDLLRDRGLLQPRGSFGDRRWLHRPASVTLIRRTSSAPSACSTPPTSTSSGPSKGWRPVTAISTPGVIPRSER